MTQSNNIETCCSCQEPTDDSASDVEEPPVVVPTIVLQEPISNNNGSVIIKTKSMETIETISIHQEQTDDHTILSVIDENNNIGDLEAPLPVVVVMPVVEVLQEEQPISNTNRSVNIIIEQQQDNNSDNNDDDDVLPKRKLCGLFQMRKNGWKTRPIFYSPAFYWFKLLLSLAGLLSGINSIIEYNHNCVPGLGPITTRTEDDDDDDAVGDGEVYYYWMGWIWWIVITVLWFFQGSIHGLFIVERYINKKTTTVVSRELKLYDTPLERKLHIPLVIDLGLIIVCCIYGFIMADPDPASILPEQCDGKEDAAFTRKSILHLLIGSLILLSRLNFYRCCLQLFSSSKS